MFKLPDPNYEIYQAALTSGCRQELQDYGTACAKAALEAAARECDRQQIEEGECPERASYCAEAIRNLSAEIA